jgi:UDP-N-acetylmuramate dehydrogenase
VSFDWFKTHAVEFSGELKWDESLARHTYYRIGGPASLMVIPKTKDDLIWIARGLQQTGQQFCIFGLGSNFLVSDLGFQGVVIKSSRLALDVERLGQNLIRIGSGVSVASLLRKCTQEGWGGLEFLTGVPGSIGGAVTMNAGTHLGEASSRLRKVVTVNLSRSGVVREYSGEELVYQYRKNHFLSPGEFVWETEWEITSSSPAEVKALVDMTLARRKQSQPVDFPSCGSVFKNPKSSGLHAWQVIDRLGMRGKKCGDAQVAEKHSNFFINLGQAKAQDIRTLIEEAKERAKLELGITLEEEVKYLGEFPGYSRPKGSI